jgi:uncharacterized membrane protein
MAYTDEAADSGVPGSVSEGRVLALSDGVFAIAMTLLVLSLGIGTKVPAADVARKLRDEIPDVLAYGLSFAVIGLFWLGHQRLYASLRVVDHGMAVLNLIVLGFVALVPFPTELFGAYPISTATVVLYAATMVLLASVTTSQWLYASRHRLFAPWVSDAFITHAVLRGATLAVVFGISIPVAFASPRAAEWTWLLLIPLRLLLTHHFGKIHRQGAVRRTHLSG